MTSPTTSESSQAWIDAAEPEERIGPVSTSTRLATHGPMLSAHGSSGVRIAMRELRRIGVWELTEPLGRSETDGLRDDVPSAEAAALFTSGGEALSTREQARLLRMVLEQVEYDRRSQSVRLTLTASAAAAIDQRVSA